MTTTSKTRRELYNNIMQKSSEDADFRAALIADPKSTLEKEYDVNIPENTEIKVHESDLNTVHLSLLPSPQVLHEGQLSDISAGFDGPDCSCDCLENLWITG